MGRPQAAAFCHRMHGKDTKLFLTEDYRRKKMRLPAPISMPKAVFAKAQGTFPPANRLSRPPGEAKPSFGRPAQSRSPQHSGIGRVQFGKEHLDFSFPALHHVLFQ